MVVSQATDERTKGKVYQGPERANLDEYVHKNNSLGEYLLNKLKDERCDDIIFVSAVFSIPTLSVT